MENAFETDNLNTHNARSEYEPYAAIKACSASSGREDDVNNTHPLEIIWHPDDVAAHAEACRHASACMLEDETLFSDGNAIVRIVDGHRVEHLTRDKLRYDILQFLDLKRRDGVRILPPVGIVHHVLSVLLARLSREHPPPSKIKDGTRRRSVSDDGCPASTRKFEDETTHNESAPCRIL